MITGIAHSAICVPDVEEAVRWYESVLGLTVLFPPTPMEGEALDRDMGELVPRPVAIKGALLGLPESGDRVLEILEYPRAPGRPRPEDAAITDHGLTHVGLVCDDLEAERARLEQRGVRFLTRGSAAIAGLRTTWFRDPWGVVFILMEKRRPERPYWRQV